MANQYVSPHKGSWKVQKESGLKPTIITATKKEAVIIAKQIAKNQEGELIVKNKNGQISEKNTYSKKDPFPPKG